MGKKMVLSTVPAPGELEAVRGPSRGVFPCLGPYGEADTRLLMHLALVLGCDPPLAAEWTESADAMLEKWFPWLAGRVDYSRNSDRRATAMTGIQPTTGGDRETLAGHDKEPRDDQLLGRALNFQAVWHQLRQAQERDNLRTTVQNLAQVAQSSLDMLARDAASKSRASDTTHAGQERFAALQRNAPIYLCWALLDERKAELREKVFPLLRCLSSYCVPTDSRTIWEVYDVAPSIDSGREDSVQRLLALMQKLLVPTPERLPTCAALAIVVRELAGSLTKDGRWLNSPPYRKLLWQSLDAVSWYCIIRGLFAEEQPSLAHLPVARRPSADSFLWLIAEFGYAVLGIDRDLRVHEHFRRAVQHEVLLYHSRAEYRDHLFHAVDTFLIGIALLTGYNSPIDSLLSTKDNPDAKNLLQEWFLASLYHDFGYVMELIPHTLRLAQQFPINGMRRLVTELEGQWNAQVTTLNQSLKKEQELRSEIGARRTDHGVFSYLHLRSELQRLDPIAREVSTMAGPPETWDSENCRRHSSSLRAILKHNLVQEPVDVQQEPLTALLVLCDEVQEWQRPQYNSWELAYHSVVAIHDNDVRSPAVRRVCDAVRFSKCRYEDAIVYDSAVLEIVLQYADQNLNRFDPISRLLFKVFNLERLKGLKDVRVVLEIRIRRLPLRPRFPQSPMARSAVERVSELDILRDFCLLREVGVSPELFTRVPKTYSSFQRCHLSEIREGRELVDVIRLDLRGFRESVESGTPLIRVPPWSFQRAFFEFKREYCRRRGIECVLFRGDEEWPEQQIIRQPDSCD